MHHYYGGPSDDNPDMKEPGTYLPQVFEKVAENLKCYLERGEPKET